MAQDILLIKKMILKKHFNEGRLILAMCDKDLLGKSFEDNKSILNLKSGFYKGEESPIEVVVSLFKKAYIINAVGKKSVALLVKENVVLPDQIKEIKNIPYIQIVFDEKR